MYNTNKVIGVTRDDVLSVISEYDIFVRYLGFKPTVGQLFSSPFRQDSNPSFGLFYSKHSRELMFKDFGTGEAGDCFKFAALMENVSIRKVVRILYENNSVNRPKKTKKIPVKEVEDKDVIVEDIPFTAEGYAYWNGFGISPETLEKYNVKQINRFWVNGIEYWRASKAKPMFSYFIYSKVKIYRPFYKKMKFYSTCTTSYIQGWEQLDYSKDTVIITKSMKDVMLLSELGYAAIAPNGEGHAIPDKALEILRENFKNIVLFYDRDLPGMLASRRLLKLHNDFKYMFTPRGTEKDLSDYYAARGAEDTKNMLTEKLCKLNISTQA